MIYAGILAGGQAHGWGLRICPNNFLDLGGRLFNPYR